MAADTIEKGGNTTAEMPPNHGRQRRDKILFNVMRWLIVFIYLSFACVVSFQWLQIPIVGHIVEDHYDISTTAARSFTDVFMYSFAICVLPAMWIQNKVGIADSLLLANVLNTFGSFLKLFGTTKENFVYLFIGQCIVASSHTFDLIAPIRMAENWFGKDTALATSFAVMGSPMGSALGFVLTPAIVKASENPKVVEAEFRYLFGVNFVASVIILVMTFLFVQDLEDPNLPPGQEPPQGVGEVQFWASLWRLLKNLKFLGLVFSYGINIGISIVLATFLNPVIMFQFPDSDTTAGYMGLTFILSGVVGSFTAGVFMQFVSKRPLHVVTYVMCVLVLIAYLLVIHYKNLIGAYILFAALGFVTDAYVPICFEIVFDLTYPESQTLTCGFIGFYVKTIVIGFNPLSGFLMDTVGILWMHIALVILMSIGCVIASCIPYVDNRVDM